MRRTSALAPLLVAALLLGACAAGPDRSGLTSAGAGARAEQWQRYENPGLALALMHPPDWRVLRSNAGRPTEVVNVFPHDAAGDLPLLVHAEPRASFVSVFPRGYGTELPAGDSRPLAESCVLGSLGIEYDAQRSAEFLLDDGAAWGFIVYPVAPPPGWSDGAFVFAQIEVLDFRAECAAADSGRPVAMDECDPLLGDEFRRFGRVDPRRQDEITRILASLELGDSGPLVDVEAPAPGATVASPLAVRGRARGPWYFEGTFPVRLLDAAGRELAAGAAVADGNWMTDDWVAFGAELEFDAPDTGTGTLVVANANPSGRREAARSVRIPVRFGTP